jgi:hypothetical protein
MLFGVGRLVVPDAEAVVTRRDEVGDGRLGSFVAGELRRDELAIRHVAVQGVDDPVAVAPYERLLAIAFVAIGLGVAHEIEPVLRPPHAVLRRCEQALDHRVQASGEVSAT